MGEPEIVDWERQAGYSFDRGRSAASHPTLQLNNLLAHMRERNTPIGRAGLKTHIGSLERRQRRLHQNVGGLPLRLRKNAAQGETYVLRDGVWYVVRREQSSSAESTRP